MRITTSLRGILCGCLLLSHPVLASDNIEKAGDVLQLLVPGIAYGATFYMDDEQGRMQFYQSFAATVAVTYGLKYSVDKKRPNGSDHSFPSGHTSAAFQGASFIQRRYGWRYSLPAYLAASFVGYSRVESDNHYVEDVLAGAAIGIASSYYFVEPYQGVTLSPYAEKDSYGISMRMDW